MLYDPEVDQMAQQVSTSSRAHSVISHALDDCHSMHSYLSDVSLDLAMERGRLMVRVLW